MGLPQSSRTSRTETDRHATQLEARRESPSSTAQTQAHRRAQQQKGGRRRCLPLASPHAGAKHAAGTRMHQSNTTRRHRWPWCNTDDAHRCARSVNQGTPQPHTVCLLWGVKLGTTPGTWAWHCCERPQPNRSPMKQPMNTCIDRRRRRRRCLRASWGFAVTL